MITTQMVWQEQTNTFCFVTPPMKLEELDAVFFDGYCEYYIVYDPDDSFKIVEDTYDPDNIGKRYDEIYGGNE